MLIHEHPVEMFECSEVTTVKGDKDRHHFAGRQPPGALSAALAGGQHPLPPKRFHPTAEVVHVTKQRFPIHGILSSLASLPETNWGEYLFSCRKVIPNSGC
jgi:hypothetical protein